MYGQEKISADRAYAMLNTAAPPTQAGGLVADMNSQLQDLRLFAQQLAARATRCADKLLGPVPRDVNTKDGTIERTPAEMEQMNRTVSFIRGDLHQLESELQRLETL